MKEKILHDGDVCCICLEPVSIPIRIIPCNHIFDYDCLLKWIYHSVDHSSKCPIDRSYISDIEPICLHPSSQVKLIISGSRGYGYFNYLNRIKKIIYVDKNCQIERIRKLVSMGIFSCLNIFHGIALAKERDDSDENLPVRKCSSSILFHNRRKLNCISQVKDISLESEIDLFARTK